MRRRLNAAVVLICIATLVLAACGKSADDLLAAARALEQRGDRNAAILQLKSTLQDHPEHVGSRLYLGLLYLDAGEYPSSEKELRRAIDGNADASQAYPALAKALVMQGEAKKLLADVGENRASDPKAVARILAARGTAYLLLGQTEEAKAAFDKSQAADPSSADALVGRARLFAASRNWNDALVEVAKALQLAPSDVEAMMLQGDLLRASGKTEESEVSYKKVIAAHPDHVGGLLAMVSMSIATNHLEDASKYLAAVRKAAPGNSMAWYFQALVAFRKNDFKAARDSIGALLKVAPNHLPSVLLGGAIEFALGSQELAQSRLKFVLERAPNNAYARRVLAASYSRAGQTQKALETLEPALKAGTKDPAMLALAGEVYMQLNDFDRARGYFEQASSLDPKNARMRTGLGVSRLAAGDVDAATVDLESAAQLDTNRNQADVLLVSTYLQRKQFNQALKAARALSAKQPDSPVGDNLAAAAHLGLKDENAARASLIRALEVQPSYVPAAANLAQLDLRKGDKLAARKRFEDIIARDKQNVQAYIALARLGGRIGATQDEIQKWLELARAADPTAMQPLVLLTRVLVESGKIKYALEILDRAVVTSPERGDLLELLGQTQLAAGEKNRALGTFGKLVTSFPSPSSFYLLGTAQVAGGDLNGAIKSLKKATELRDRFPEAKLLLAELEAKVGRIAEALKIAANLQSQDSKSPVGWVAEGDIYMRDKKFSLAVKAYEKAFGMTRGTSALIRLHGALVGDGRNAEGLGRLRDHLKQNPADGPARLYLAEQLIQTAKYAEAAVEYELLMKQLPDNVSVINNLAWSYLHLKDKRAVETADRALRLSPDNPAVLDTLGWVLSENGDYKRGLEMLKRAVELAPKTPEIRYHYGIALVRSGDRARAKEELESLLFNFPQFSQSGQAMKELSALRKQ